MDFSARIPAVQSGKYDFTTAMNVTPERQEQALFSAPASQGGIVLAVRAADLALRKDDEDHGTIVGIKELNGARIGVQTGSTFDEIVRENLPEAQLSYFNSYPDMAAALLSGKIDAFPGDEPVIRMMAAEYGYLGILEDHLDNFEFGFVLPKNAAGEKLCGEINEWLASVKKSGELDEIASVWISGAEEEKVIPDYASFPAPNGTLTMAAETAYAPMCYYRGNEIVGFEVCMAAKFCEDCGYGLRITNMAFDAVLPSVQTGKADFGLSSVTITEERAQSVNFSDPYYTGGTVMAVLKSRLPGADGAGSGTQAESGLGGIAASFSRTFLREGRWKLFLEGIGTTLLITVLAILFGTVLGFLVFLWCRNGNPAANAVTRFCVWLVQGMPMVVLLMILYYIIFGSVSISGIAVAVIGFTLTFGSAVFALLKMGVGTVDRGQYEAAYALGHSSRHTFFRIILPQAIPHILPAYQGEIVSLIKATAVVGYIAVQDLTKMGDIVRSRTYEAFFPLIAVTVIYFVLEMLLGFAVGCIRIRVDPKMRKPEKILKGIDTGN